MYCIDINAELAEAAQAQRDLELAGELSLRPWPARDWEAEHEAHAERAAIMGEGAEGLLGPGLVSVPTRSKHAADVEHRERSAALRRALKATEVDKHRARIARLRRSVGFAARGHAAGDRPGFRPDDVLMLTLTYREDVQWEPQHIKRCLDLCRKAVKAAGGRMRYVWVAELQKRGAVHYHVGFWVPHGATLPFFDEVGWWPHGDTKIERARHAVSYFMKYISKGLDAAAFPSGLRMHGCGGLDHSIRRAKRWLGCPAFVKSRADINDDWRRMPPLKFNTFFEIGSRRMVTGGGWLDPSGCWWPSEFKRAWVGDRWSCINVHSHGRPFEVAGPFSWLPSEVSQ